MHLSNRFWRDWLEARTIRREKLVESLTIINDNPEKASMLNSYFEDLLAYAVRKFKADLLQGLLKHGASQECKDIVLKVIKED